MDWEKVTCINRHAINMMRRYANFTFVIVTMDVNIVPCHIAYFNFSSTAVTAERF
jgi:hypothetical protein